MIRLICLLVVAVVLAGCEQEVVTDEVAAAKHGALVLTCAPNISIYQWKGKLFYKDDGHYSFRQVVATLDDVCSKFSSAPASKAKK